MREFDRQPKESAKAYEAAKTYFEMGTGRRLIDVAEKYQKSIALINRWSQRHNWVRRAHLYDTYLDDEAEKEIQRLRKKQIAKQKHWRIETVQSDKTAAEGLRKRAAELMAAPIVTSEAIEYTKITPEMVGKEIPTKILMKPAGWRQRDIALLQQTASKLERLASELPTDTIDINIDSADQVSEEVLKAAKSLFEELCRLHPTMPRDVIAERLGQKYRIEPAMIISEMIS